MALGRLDKARATQPMSDINMTPLIDVMLVLLVIFILTAPVLTHSLKLELPKVAAPTTTDAPKVIAISIDAQETLYLDNQAISLEDLKQHFSRATNSNTRLPDVQIKADQSVRYKVLASVMGAAQTAGLTRIALVTEQPSQDGRTAIPAPIPKPIPAPSSQP